MAPLGVVLHGFRSLLPRHRIDQQASIDWLARAHAFAEAEGDRETAFLRMRKMISRFGCSPERIQSRYSVLSDFTNDEQEKREVFDLNVDPAGRGTHCRSLLFREIVNEIFEKLYVEETSAPDKLFHITCTGYVSPSGAQHLVAQKDWGRSTEVAHLYHMGCYASLPAIQIAKACLEASSGRLSRIDLVHTELCTLHLNPAIHSPEQLVVESLFADGLIRYQAQPLSSRIERGFEVLALREEIVPNTEGAMTWVLGDHGFRMTLSRDVPDLIASVLEPYLARLFHEAGFSYIEKKAETLFAIHPGGPKIVDRVKDILRLEERQIAATRGVLLQRGNMSSATLPHIWQAMLDDVSLPDGTLIVSLGFGPGFTVSGGLFRKIVRP